MKIILMMAVTADGKIAKSTSHAADWTSKEDKQAFIKETKKAGVIVMGRNTYETIGRPLPGRLNLILAENPEDYQDAVKPGNLEFFKGSPQEIYEFLAKRKFETVILGGGASVNQSFMVNNLVDELLITIEPKLFGRGMSLFTESLDIDLELLDLVKLNPNTIQLRYRVIK